METFESGILKLKNNPYPGRGIVIGLSPDGLKWFQVYWIMGRSKESRNRVFVEENGFLYTRVFDEKLVIKPELLIYSPMKHINKKHIVTNGNHTDIIENYVKNDKDIYNALTNVTYEPDEPHFTPRIAGVLDLEFNSFCLVILKKHSSDSKGCLKAFYYYDNPTYGTGYCLHTYNANKNPLPSFEGEPLKLPLQNSAKENLDFFWEILNSENKVSLAVKEIETRSFNFKIEIINKNK